MIIPRDPKCNRMVCSCTTPEQMSVAFAYINLACRAGVIKYSELMYWAGVIDALVFERKWNEKELK